MTKRRVIALQPSLTGSARAPWALSTACTETAGQSPLSHGLAPFALDVKRTEGPGSPYRAGSMTNCPQNGSRGWLILLGSVGPTTPLPEELLKFNSHYVLLPQVIVK